MTPIPDSIPYSSIDLGIRARTNHNDIEPLADDIASIGLIQPIVITEKSETLVADYENEFGAGSLDPSKPYLLTAGGRRSCALELLGVTTLYHGATSDPERPGFVLRGERPLLDQLILEGRENRNRQAMDWRDELKLIVRAYRLAKREANERGEVLVMDDFGATLGLGSRAKIQVGERIYDMYMAQPEKFAEATSMFQAAALALKLTSTQIAKYAISKQMAEKPVLTELTPGPVEHVPQSRLQVSELESPNPTQTVPIPNIPLSGAFLNTDAYDFLAKQKPGFCHHIICDPDYCLSLDQINSGPNNRPGLMSDGIQQTSPEESLAELCKLPALAFHALPDHGFFIFWCVIDHWHKLASVCKAAGFAVQTHPLIWNKVDARGRANAAPNYNFPPSYELAMVCRKPGTVLAKVQTTAVYTSETESVVKSLGHPFAKPFEVWRWLYKAVATEGQIVYDPFVGCGSAAIAASMQGLRPIGTEKDPGLYAHLILNLQQYYRKLYNGNCTFS